MDFSWNLLIFFQIIALLLHCSTSTDDCSPVNNLNDKIRSTDLIISGRVLNLDDKTAIVLVLKTLKGFEIIGNLKKASQSNDYHLIMIINVAEKSHCQSRFISNQDYIFLLKSTSKPNSFQVLNYEVFGDGDLESKIIKSLNGGFSKQVQNDDPCSKLTCKYGAKCKLWPGEPPRAVCHCPNSQCRSQNTKNKICGSDGTFYESDCHLKLRECLVQRSIHVSPAYVCDSSLEIKKTDNEVAQQDGDNSFNSYSCARQSCPPYAVCVSYPYPHCKCPNDQCLPNSPFICGTDEITYSNLCEMKKVSCKANRLINEQYKGKCDMCKFIKCEYNSQCKMNEAGTDTVCICQKVEETCPAYNNVEVCASDDVTYPSECHMKIAACNKHTQLHVIHKGACKMIDKKEVCSDRTCIHEARCVTVAMNEIPTAQCSCQHLDCANEWPEPICADDGKSYSNKCFMRRAACEKQRSIEPLYQGQCQQNPCMRVKCANPHQYCRVDVNGRGVCVCPDSCPNIIQPVCGNDGLNYDSVCHLIKFACQSQKPLFVVHNGICSEEPRCQEQGHNCVGNQICRSDLRQTKCECATCPEAGLGEHVCGTNGKTYRSECHLRKTTCENKDSSTSVAHLGACDACRQKKCSYYAICKMNRFGEPQCICPTDCVYHPQVRSPVCGSDGRTYENECFLKVKSCAENRKIDIIGKGPCKKCQNDCPLGQMCRNGQCVCTEKCSKLKLRVCGSDGNYYQNECELKRQACIQKKTIHIDFSEASCISRQYISDENLAQNKQRQTNNNKWNNGASMSLCYCNKLGSVNPICDSYSGRCTCKNGVTGKLCDQCSAGYWKLTSTGCTACSCSKFGSESIQCDQTTGMCKCKPKAMGKYCSVCPHGYEMSNDGCILTFKNQDQMDLEELGFMKDSFATAYWNGNADKYLLLNITILPYDEDGILLYISNPTRSADYMSLVLNKGYVELRFDLGSGALLLKSSHIIETGKSHNIVAERYERYARLTIGGRDMSYGTSPPVMTSLDSGAMFTIGQPKGIKTDQLKQTGSVIDGFVGCLKSLTIKAGHEITNYKMNRQNKWITESSNVKPNCPHRDLMDKSQQSGNSNSNGNDDNNNNNPANNNNNYQPQHNGGYCSSGNPCNNNGICREISNDVYNCICQPGFQGLNCDDYVAPIWKFQKQSFVVFPTEFLQLRKRLKLELKFLPTSGNGLLAFISDGHDKNPAFISVMLINSYVYVICRTPIGVTQLTSGEPIKIGKWNQLTALKAAKYVYLNLNLTPKPEKKRLIPRGFSEIASYVRRKLTQFRITNQPLFFGGVDERIYRNFVSVVKLKPNFQGAIQKIVVNGEPLTLEISEGDVMMHNISQWQGAPCGPLHNPCSKTDPQKSYCMPNMDKTLCFCNPQQQHLCLKDSMQHDNPSVTNFNRRFNKESIVKYTSIKNNRMRTFEKNNIRFTFKTNARDGAILLMKKGHSVKKNFFIIAIRNSVIEVAINLGGPNGIIRVTSNRKISDNKWHTVQVIRNQRNVVLLVDNRMFRAQMLKDKNHNILHTDGWLWLGGSRKPISGFPWEYNTKFAGCISELYVSEVAYSLISDARKNIGPILKC